MGIKKCMSYRYGADVNYSDGDNTPLMEAARNGHIEIMKYLISHGADIHKTDNSGKTCLHVAVLNDKLDIVQYLASIGADIHHTDE